MLAWWDYRQNQKKEAVYKPVIYDNLFTKTSLLKTTLLKLLYLNFTT